MANQSDFLMDCFREFYQELIEIKEELAHGKIAAVRTGEKQSIREVELAPLISNRLSQLLRQQTQDVSEHKTVAEIDAYQTAQYLMAVLADEIFILELEWPGQEEWEHYLLEMCLFGTQSSGVVFFEKLEEVLQTREGGELQQGLAALFLFALRLGFRGRYRVKGGAERLQKYRQRLYRLLGDRKRDPESLLFKGAYQSLVNPEKAEHLAPLGRWVKLSVESMVYYVIMASLIWIWIILDLWKLLQYTP